MSVDPKAGGVLALAGSATLGAATASYYADLWFGAVVAVLTGVVAAGSVLFPRAMAHLVGPNRSRWASVLGVVAVVVLFTPRRSSVFTTDHLYATMLFLLGVLTCGVVVGVGIQRES
ncbi:hypothetical protein [Halorussus halobius]|uniref:hypothetical protein n=1 Tax=Halorussus halobius TaxID=1710537 RepID=UPI001091E2D7|nr:hypothetical protein [Halorussus halobius]